MTWSRMLMAKIMNVSQITFQWKFYAKLFNVNIIIYMHVTVTQWSFMLHIQSKSTHDINTRIRSMSFGFLIDCKLRMKIFNRSHSDSWLFKFLEVSVGGYVSFYYFLCFVRIKLLLLAVREILFENDSELSTVSDGTIK